MNCKKTNDYIIPLQENKVEITLNEDFQILKAVFYHSDTIFCQKSNTFLTNMLRSVESDRNDNVTKISTYYLNDIALADSCVDSIFNSNSNINIVLAKYTYDNNGYKSTVNLNYKCIINDSVISTSNMDLIYSYSEGNVSSIYVNRSYVDYFEYYQMPNKIDISDYIGNYCGKIDRNLLLNSKISGSFGPHTSMPHHVYYYLLNSDGFVLEKKDLYTPSYDAAFEDPKPIKIVTQYKYIFQ